jgi:hypothetical protein
LLGALQCDESLTFHSPFCHQPHIKPVSGDTLKIKIIICKVDRWIEIWSKDELLQLSFLWFSLVPPAKCQDSTSFMYLQ